MELTFPKVETHEDIAEVAMLAAAIWGEYYVALIGRDQVDYMVEKYQSLPAITAQIGHQGYEYYLLRRGSETVGYMGIKQEDGRLFLSKLYIDKRHRGKGYASHANAFLERLCADRGLDRIWLTVNRDNASSIAVYEKKGFRKVREQVADIGNGYVMDDFVMEKEIPVPAE
ncbi:GNAT family N-acetyltransferase [Saccharibacillus sp. O23]|uniref:GNAT family N-acetyltransferase n=1 Tax=Saccharibacillus sp. O23 TaxID=2009338 RepID=UPI000B4E175B|nr:GNAT family N-acetyltransferase [Saccharibacillus sp. O23]OWR27691.1 GNAT family N-acetyltransferase [Saccharibacillus sp. O23]